MTANGATDPESNAPDPVSDVPIIPPDPPISAATPIRPPPPGSTTFTIEGRQAPALFMIGWGGSVGGIVTIAIGLLSGGGGAAPWLILAGLLLLSLGLVAGAGSQGIERQASGRSGYAGPSPLLVFAASIPVSILAVVALGIPLGAIGLPMDGPLARLGSVIVQAFVYLGLVRLLVVDGGALTWAGMQVRRFDRAAVGEVLAGALWAAPTIVVTIPIAAILSTLLPVTPVSPLPPTGELSGLLINLLAGAVVAPLGEELMFRAFATTAWTASLGARRGLIRGALFFAVVHVLTISGSGASEALAMAVVGFASRIPVAIALGLVFQRRRSVWASVGLHAAFNGILIVLGEAALRSGA